MWHKYKEGLTLLQKSIKNATPKYNKTKDPASKNSISYMKNLTNDDPVTIHPMLLSQIDNKEQALVDFKN